VVLSGMGLFQNMDFSVRGAEISCLATTVLKVGKCAAHLQSM
jgi:hypothetical protein